MGLTAYKRVCQALIVFLLLFSSAGAAAQQITPHFLPEGLILELDGEEVIAYNFEQFRLLLELDENLFFARQEVESQQAHIQILIDQTNLVERSFAALEISFRDLEGLYHAAESSLEISLRDNEELSSLLQQCSEQRTPRGRTFLNPVHLAIEGGLIAVIVTILVVGD